MLRKLIYMYGGGKSSELRIARGCICIPPASCCIFHAPGTDKMILLSRSSEGGSAAAPLQSALCGAALLQVRPQFPIFLLSRNSLYRTKLGDIGSDSKAFQNQ